MKYFWLTTVLVILQIKISLVSIKIFLYHCHLSYTRRASSHRLLHLYFLGQCNICMIYMYVKEACLKVIFAMFYFCHLNYSSNIVKNIFNSISIYFWKKISLFKDLRQFLITEIPLKMMKNAFYFTLKALFVLKIFKFLSWLFRHV